MKQRISVRHLAKFSGYRSNRCTDMPIFRFVKMTAVWHVEVETFEILSYQISWRSVKPLLSYGDLTVFKMAAILHLGF